MNFQFANTDELNFGATMQDLLAAESLAILLQERRMKESFFKTEAEFCELLGLRSNVDEDIDSLNYAVNVCNRIFPHHVKIVS